MELDHYESARTYSATANRYETAEVATAQIVATPQSTIALRDLADASAVYAAAAETYVIAREHLNGVRARWQECRDLVAKSSEQEGV